MPESEKPKYAPEFWTLLFEKYYHDDILDLAGAFPDRCSLVVQFRDMDYCWGHRSETATSAIEYIINNPEQALDDARDALREYELPNDPHDDWKRRTRVEMFRYGLQ